MTYAKHVLLQWGGDLTAGEIWSNSLRIFFGPTIPPYTDRRLWCDNNIDDVAADVVSFVARSDSHLGTRCKLRFVKLNPIGEDGHYESDDTTVEKTYNTIPYPAGSGGVYLPHQVCTVATLGTNATRGRGSKGRIFLPTASIGIVDTTQQMSESDATGIANSVKTFVNDLNNQPGIDIADPQVSVMSKLGDPGPHRAVNHVEVDTRLDIQRRRANNVTAVRVSVNL